MDFTREEMKVLLQALYRFRGDVSGASQSEQNKFALVEGVIGKIEKESGPLAIERTRFDREMEENLSVLARGGEWPSKGALDNVDAAPKAGSKARAGAGKSPGAAARPAKGKAAAAKAGGKAKASGGGSAKAGRAAKR